MANPEGDPKIDLSAFIQGIGSKPQAGGGEIDTDVENIIPLASFYELTRVDNEEELREALLDLVTVDEHGIARSTNPDTNITSSIVAVRIQDHDATVVPFELDEDGLVLPLPGDTGSQIGFVIGHDSESQMATTVRQGDYPGIPLVTAKSKIYDTHDEVVVGLRGIKATETDEATWAEQIGLYDTLGFTPSQTRGVFSRVHSEDPKSTTLKSRRLLILPDSMRDLAKHFDAFEVTKDRMQVMTYTEGLVRVRPTREINPHMMDGLGMAFGNEYTQHANLERAGELELRSAFQIRFAPQAK